MRRLLVFSFVLFAACQGPETPADKSGSFNVTAVGVNADCGKSMIQFNASDSARIKEITGMSGLTYIAVNLAASYAEGTELTVTVRKPHSDELGTCTAMGPGYPWVAVVKVERN